MIYTYLDPVKQELGKRLMSNTESKFILVSEPEKPADTRKSKLKEARLRAKEARNARKKKVAPLPPAPTNIEIHERNTSPVIPLDAHLISVQGIMRGSGDIITQAQERKIQWMYLDYGYIGKEYRVCVNETAPTRLFDGSRFDHKTQILTWKGGHGSDILILPPSEFYSEHFGLQEFLYEAVNKISLYTARPIVVRPKPFKDRKAFDLESQLRKTYCVVTWGSALALECLRRGIPVISLGSCPTKPLSFNYTDLDTMKMEVEPDRKRLFDSLT